MRAKKEVGMPKQRIPIPSSMVGSRANWTSVSCLPAFKVASGQFHLGISGGRIRANNRGVVSHP